MFRTHLNLFEDLPPRVQKTDANFPAHSAVCSGASAARRGTSSLLQKFPNSGFASVAWLLTCPTTPDFRTFQAIQNPTAQVLHNTTGCFGASHKLHQQRQRHRLKASACCATKPQARDHRQRTSAATLIQKNTLPRHSTCVPSKGASACRQSSAHSGGGGGGLIANALANPGRAPPLRSLPLA